MRPVFYTFGNHMHWVDMHWLWGDDVLPGSVRDMLRLCDEADVKGNVNFDGVGYEKLAAEAPESLAALREAVRAGRIEIVGASYGQPYGQFHGGESNIRHRVHGVRAVERLLGVRPRTFWEEEFDFFPQLPQILRGVGMDRASLFFQWTWHTPHVPVEAESAIWWEGMDGSRLLAAPRNTLNLHQWPEDFDGLLESPTLREMRDPLILQWLELMPSKDWMCRSELLLPRLRELQADPRFEIIPVTLGEFLERARDRVTTVRRYAPHQVFHGMSLGKNGDAMRRLSRAAEAQLLAAESLGALMGLFGRPYPQWDVYPAWELEEAWRELMIAQHHDNDECEGLCGHVGARSYERSLGLSRHALDRTLDALERRAGEPCVFNPLGWPQDMVVQAGGVDEPRLVRGVPAFGYAAVSQAEPIPHGHFGAAEVNGAVITLRRGALSVAVDARSGRITRLTGEHHPAGALAQGESLFGLTMVQAGQPLALAPESVAVVSGAQPSIRVTHAGQGWRLTTDIRLVLELDAVRVTVQGEPPRPDGGMNAALQAVFDLDLAGRSLIHDHPYGLSAAAPSGSFIKKYPTGDWMTSPQWTEHVRDPFTALRLVDVAGDGRGLLIAHDGSQQFFLRKRGFSQILTMTDPWDEDFVRAGFHAQWLLVPHGGLTHAERWKLSHLLPAPVGGQAGPFQRVAATRDLPARFGAATCDNPHVALTAFYREQRNPHLPLENPYVLRLVEFDGRATTARVVLPGRIAAALKTNLLGEVERALDISPAAPPMDHTGLVEWSAVDVPMRSHEIATVAFDLELGRKRARDLDAHRGVWARR